MSNMVISLLFLPQAPLLKAAQGHQDPLLDRDVSKTWEWRLANAPGLLVVPTRAMLRSDREPEGYDELLLALTRVLQPGW
jgi:hypothetical protein